MAGVFDLLLDVFGDSSTMLLALLIFLATTVLTLVVMLTVRSRGAVKRRTAGLGDLEGNEPGALRATSLKAVQRVLDYTTKHYAASEKDKGDMKVLRRRMVQAGIFDPRAVGYFFVARTALAVGLALTAFFVLPMFIKLQSSVFWLTVVIGGIVGYVGPSMYIDRRISTRRNEHRS
jgi:tight adherence protein C